MHKKAINKEVYGYINTQLREAASRMSCSLKNMKAASDREL